MLMIRIKRELLSGRAPEYYLLCSFYLVFGDCENWLWAVDNVCYFVLQHMLITCPFFS